MAEGVCWSQQVVEVDKVEVMGPSSAGVVVVNKRAECRGVVASHEGAGDRHDDFETGDTMEDGGWQARMRLENKACELVELQIRARGRRGRPETRKS